MEERSLVLHGLPDDFDRVKSKLELHFKNKRRSGGEVLQIREHPDDKRKARLIYVTEEDMKKVLDKRIHKLDFKTHGSVEVTVKLAEDCTSNKKMKPAVLPKPKLEKVGKVLQASHTQVCPVTTPATTSHKDNEGGCEKSDLLITAPHTVDKEMLQMYCERFTEHFVLQKHGNHSWILKLSNQSDLQKILGQNKQELGISIEVYKEGKLDPRRFILTGFDGSTDWMKISLFIGSCSKTTEHDWEILDEEGIVVTFRQDIDVTTFINKCTSKALQGREIGVTRLELTDSVLVQGDLGKISEDALNLHFSNTTQSGGGDIKSLIWINRQKSLLITFQQSEVAHEVVEQEHSVCGAEVKASLFYSSLGKALTGERPTLTDIPTRINISVHEDLLRFIENNDPCRNALESVVKPLHAKILMERSVDASAIRLEMDFDKTSLTALQIGPTWETKTERKVQIFLSKYHTVELNVQEDVWQRVKGDCTSLSTGDTVVSFREISSKIMIAGVKEEGVVLSEKIKRLLDMAAVEMETQRNTIDVIIQLDCGEKCELLKECVKSKLGQVALSHDENQHKFHLRGLKDQVASVELLVEQVNKNIILHHLKLSSHLIHFLQSLDLHKFERDHFSTNHIPAKFSKQKDSVGIFVEKDNLKRAEDKICEILREDLVQLSPNRTDDNWTTFLMKLQGEVESSQNAHNIRITHTDVQLTLCGFSDVVAEVARKVSGYLEHKKPITEDVPLKSVREVEFVDSCLNLSERPEIKRLGATLLACRTPACPCLKVTAAKDKVKEAVSVIKKQLLDTVVERHKYRKAGEAKVLDKHEASVKAKAKEFQCNLYLSQEPVNNPDPSQSFTHKISSFITLAITRGDWYHQSADALICPMNGSLAFDNPVAKRILQFGGDQIAEVCKKHQREKKSLLPGDVLLCDAGQLNAKSLIFAVLSHKGQALDSRCLQWAIHNALLKAEEQRCTSILLPALACEIFGFSVRESWTSLREAILQFCADHQNSPQNMRDVHIVHSDRKTVEEYNAVIEELGFPDTSNVQSQRRQQGTRALINGVPIYLKKSDITKETADVIVNSNSKHLNLDTGVSGAILKAAGKSVVAECAKQAPLKAGGVVMTSGGDLKCRHIAQMVGPEGPADITSSLGKVLSLCDDKMARTLAIPAIGTGKGAIGPKESIEAILTALQKHLTELNSSRLKEITIVTFEQKILDAYRKYLSEWNKASSRRAQPAYGRMPENQVKIGSVRIELKKGDITNETVRGIVNSTNREMTLKRGVSGAIFKAAGASVEQECQKHGPLQNDIPAVTSGGNLQCDVIIHVTGPHSASETRSHVKRVLERCEEKQITTISFPAVGTGGGGVKGVDAIHAMLKGFEDHLAQNSSTVIKLIYLVIDRDDVLQEFQKGLKAWTANTQNSEEEDDEGQSEREDSDYSADEDSTSPDSEPDTTNPVEAIIGPMKVKVTCGDITKETVDAIVNSTTTSLDLNTGVSGAILKAAGKTVVNECKTKAPQPNDGVVLTKAGNLTDIRNIIHTVGQTNVKGITTSMLKVLKTCEENHIQSVSFPALGTGAGNLAATQVANAMTEALADFVKESPQHLKRVHIVIFQSKMLPDFQDAIQKLKKISSSARKTKVPPRTPASSNAPQLSPFCLAKQTASVSFPVMAVEIYGMSSDNAAKVKKYLDDLVSEECISKDVQSSHLAKLPVSDQKTIVNLSQSNEVSVLMAGPDRWTVSGKKDDVFDAMLKINNLIQEVRDQEIRDGEVKRLRQTLCWEVVRGETWQPLEPSISYEVELSYHKKNKTVQYQENGQTYTVDFKEMTLMNDGKKESCRIKRTLLGDCDTAIIHPPPTWTKTNGQDLEIITLKSDSAEYQKIEKDFLKSSKHPDVSQVQVIQIDRIQSQSQWQRYCVLKQAVDKKYPKQMNERFLYHGTTKDICQKINKNGFNRSFCGRNAVVHGDGTYFAKEAWYSCQDLYSNLDDKGLKYIYRAKVVTGSLCESRQGMKEPDPINAQDPQAGLHDCAVDRLQTPFIFVVFCDAGAYPEYLITVKNI